MQINNLARDNLRDKLGIMSDLVTDEFWPWFANYMVVKRAAQVSYIASEALLASFAHDTVWLPVEACASCNSAPVGTCSQARMLLCPCCSQNTPRHSCIQACCKSKIRECYPPLSHA